ncbi:MAG: glutamate--tRNA ligase, partial [Calditrichaeota bacterium]|nr:glutamate--tRNA ligase [Calditrichota bacterium]
MSEVRVRFAPSPTGYLHVGGLRTALYNYLYAKKHNGKFILRIEDTDQTRYVEGATENLLKTLRNCGLDYDEGPDLDGGYGPYTQSKRTDIYRQYAKELLDNNKAYRCFCSPERLDELRNLQRLRKEPPGYDGRCRLLSQDQIEENLTANLPYTIRLRVPEKESIKYYDEIRGWISFESNTVDDQVLVKSDNFPTYHLANVVDDHLMKISHVIRGEEWLPSVPKHVLLYMAFGWELPKFAHLPLLLNPDRTKLSKRQGDVAVEDFLDKGYVLQA